MYMKCCLSCSNEKFWPCCHFFVVCRVEKCNYKSKYCSGWRKRKSSRHSHWVLKGDFGFTSLVPHRLNLWTVGTVTVGNWRYLDCWNCHSGELAVSPWEGADPIFRKTPMNNWSFACNGFCAQIISCENTISLKHDINIFSRSLNKCN